jgi:hypothetical protein
MRGGVMAHVERVAACNAWVRKASRVRRAVDER